MLLRNVAGFRGDVAGGSQVPRGFDQRAPKVFRRLPEGSSGGPQLSNRPPDAFGGLSNGSSKVFTRRSEVVVLKSVRWLPEVAYILVV